MRERGAPLWLDPIPGVALPPEGGG
jgi:hypothetical protein